MNSPIVIRVECSGMAGTAIPLNAKLQDEMRRIYENAAGGWRVIQENGKSIVIPFLSQHPHSETIPKKVAIYEATAGWDSAKIIGWSFAGARQLNFGRFHVSNLELISPIPPPDDPPLIVGDHCRLNSGGPDCLVVDTTVDSVTIAWADGSGIGSQECELPRGNVRRI